MSSSRIPPIVVTRAHWARMPELLRRNICARLPRESVLGNSLPTTIHRLRQAGAHQEADWFLAWFFPRLVPCRRRLPRCTALRALLNQPGHLLTPTQFLLAQHAREGWSVTRIARAYRVRTGTVVRWARGEGQAATFDDAFPDVLAQ